MAGWPEDPRGLRQGARPASYTVGPNAAMLAFPLVHSLP